MENENFMKQELKSDGNSLKEKKRLVISAKSLSRGVIDKVCEFERLCNEKEFGSEVTINHIFSHAVMKLEKRDIKEIQESSLRASDKLNFALREFNKKNDTDLDLNEFLVQKLKL